VLSATAVFVQGCVGIAVEPSGRKWHLRSPEQSASESQSPSHTPHPPVAHEPPVTSVRAVPSTKERNAVAAARRAKGVAHLRSLILFGRYKLLGFVIRTRMRTILPIQLLGFVIRTRMRATPRE